MTRRNFIIYFIWVYWLEYRISWNSFKYVEILSGSHVSESLPMLALCRLVMAFSVCSSAFLGVYLWVPANFGSKNLENQLENCQKSFSQKFSEKSNMKKFWKVWEKNLERCLIRRHLWVEKAVLKMTMIGQRGGTVKAFTAGRCTTWRPKPVLSYFLRHLKWMKTTTISTKCGLSQPIFFACLESNEYLDSW